MTDFRETLCEALMLGSVNGAWVPMILQGMNPTWSGNKMTNLIYTQNVDDTDFDAIWQLPLPTTKGTLKLYITQLKVNVFDADAGDYINHLYVYGRYSAGSAALVSDATNVTAPAEKIYNFAGAPIDCSGSENIFAYFICIATNAGDLNFDQPLMYCYYE